MGDESTQEVIAGIKTVLADVRSQLDLRQGKRPPSTQAEFDLLSHMITGQSARTGQRLVGERRKVWWIVLVTFALGCAMTFAWSPSAQDALWQLGIGLVGGSVVGAVFVMLDERRGRVSKLVTDTETEHQKLAELLASLDRLAATPSGVVDPTAAELMRQLTESRFGRPTDLD